MQCGGLLVDLFWLQQANIVQEEEEEFPKYPLLYNTSYNPTLQHPPTTLLNNKVMGGGGVPKIPLV